MTFTDQDLDPRRTTKKSVDPDFDRADSLIRGDLILVDTSAYGVLGSHWCRFVYDAPGSASVYPYKAQVPERGIGQWKASEILGWARPVDLHRLVDMPRRQRELEMVKAEQNILAQLWKGNPSEGERTIIFRRMLALIQRERLLKTLVA